MPDPLQGLTEAEAHRRGQAGLSNNAYLPTGRSFLRIVRDQAFTLVNTLLFGIALVLLALGLGGDALVTAGLVLFNVGVAVIQETRAQRVLNQLALLNQPTATVIRQGEERTIDPREIVEGDLLVARPGDQIMVDGLIVGDSTIELDESLLTGESEPVARRGGDSILSGSFCITGSTTYTAQHVGIASFANRLATTARAERVVKTPMQRAVERVIQLMVILVTLVSLIVAVAVTDRVGGLRLTESVQAAAVLVALIPQGLSFMVTITYAMAAVRLGGKGILIQRPNAVESLSHVTVLCLDKTGTLTTNRLEWSKVEAIGINESTLRRCLGDLIASLPATNRTAEAIAGECGGRRRPTADAVAFSSARKWSGVVFADDLDSGGYILGAPEVVLPALVTPAIIAERTPTWANEGLRVLVVAQQASVTSLHDSAGQPALPTALVPLGLIGLRDELRPAVQTTLAGFAAVGIRLMLLSGDHPQTVAALARQAGLPEAERVQSGLAMTDDDDALARVVAETTVFGRITPEQKARLIRALQRQGAYVAMVGDGVNDLLALKTAQLGIAPRSGSQATRQLADIVLLDDAFTTLPAAFREGRRIIGGMQDILSLFLVRTLAMTMAILGAGVMTGTFPTTPKANAVLALLTVGIPTLALAGWARPVLLNRHLLAAVTVFVLPAALTLAPLLIGLYTLTLFTSGDVHEARAVMTTTAVLAGLVLIPFVEPPTPAWVAGDRLSRDWRPSVLAIGLLGLYGLLHVIPPLREFFGLVVLSWPTVLLIIGLVSAWAIILRATWRLPRWRHALRRFGRRLARS